MRPKKSEGLKTHPLPHKKLSTTRDSVVLLLEQQEISLETKVFFGLVGAKSNPAPAGGKKRGRPKEKALTPEDICVLALRQKGLSYAHIAMYLGCTRQAVHSRKRKALVKIRCFKESNPQTELPFPEWENL